MHPCPPASWAFAATTFRASVETNRVVGAAAPVDVIVEVNDRATVVARYGFRS
jgi:hypothetical protein